MPRASAFRRGGTATDESNEVSSLKCQAEPSTVVDERVQRLSDQLQNARKDAEETRKKCRQLQAKGSVG